MKKRLICLLVLTALLLTGCGQAAPAPATEVQMEVPTEAPTTEAPTTVPTEPPCEHQWSEATYMTPAVCELCGEEGAKKPSFFEEHGLNIEDAPLNEKGSTMRTIETDATMYSLKNDRFEPSTVSIRMGNWCTVPNRTENAMLYDKRIKDVEEGHQMVTFHLSVDYFAKICADGTILDHGGFNYGFYDYYTGTWLHPSQESKNGKDVFTFDLEIDGVTYTIECTNTFRRDNLRPEAQEDGSSLIVAWLIENFEFNVPFEYDGLVFGILPCRDNRGMNKTEDGKFVANLSEEANFEEGIYFRLNGSVSPWMVG